MSAANGTPVSPPDAGGGLNGSEKTVLGGAMGAAVTEATVGLRAAWQAIVSAPGDALDAADRVSPVNMAFDVSATVADSSVLASGTEVIIGL